MSTTTTSSSSTTTTISSSNSVMTQVEEGEEKPTGTCRDAPTARPDHCHATTVTSRPHQEVLPTSSSEETTSRVESAIPICADVDGNKKRASSLESQRDHSEAHAHNGDQEHYNTCHVQEQPRSTTLQDSSTTQDRFISVLDRPFKYWHELNLLFKEVHPQWSPYQRGRMIHHLIHFLELKIGLDEYIPTGLLLPTAVVDLAWRALVMETRLYLQVIHTLQDFHAKDQEMIHYTFLLTRELVPKEREDKIRRTQSLFRVYFKEIMPCSINDEPTHCPVYIPMYNRESCATPTFSRAVPQNQDCHDSPATTTNNATTMLDLSSLAHKQDSLSGLRLREDETASTQNSDDESECLMGLELLD